LPSAAGAKILNALTPGRFSNYRTIWSSIIACSRLSLAAAARGAVASAAEAAAFKNSRLEWIMAFANLIWLADQDRQVGYNTGGKDAEL